MDENERSWMTSSMNNDLSYMKYLILLFVKFEIINYMVDDLCWGWLLHVINDKMSC
jgi:hypothetical protein